MKILLTAIALATTAVAAGAAAAAPAFHFAFTQGTSLAAQQGFMAAADQWSDLLHDDVTINLTVGFNPLAPGILGQAQSAQQLYAYATFRQFLTNDRHRLPTPRPPPTSRPAIRSTCC